MSVREIKTIIQLRRDTASNWDNIKNTYIPRQGEVCFIDTEDKGLRAKVGDGVNILNNLPFTDDNLYSEIDKVVLEGYFLNGKFWTDSTYTVEMPALINRIYIDKNSRVLYNYDGIKYNSVNDGIPTASDAIAGVMKLYQTSGQNTDGTMSQKVVTNGVGAIKFSIDETDAECLTLDLPW